MATRRTVRTLNRETVITAALAEIDRHGLESFSLRNVARSLGVYPTAVTWHVQGRDHLLAEVVALALANILPAGYPESWQSYLRQFFHRYREAVRRHPNIAPLVGSQLVANRAVDLNFVEGLLGTLAHAGLSGAHLAAGYNAVIAAIVGFTTQEFAPIPSEDTKAWQKEVRERLQNVEPSRYPVLSENLKPLANHAFILRWQNGTEAPLDASFETFIDIVIAGLESLVAQTKSAKA